MKIEFKQRLHVYVLILLDAKITFIHNLLNELKNGTANDAKSSAGDKHETAISMMQLEQEKLNTQLHQLVLQKDIAQKTPIILVPKIHNVALVKTTQGYFYILAPLGKIDFEGISIVCLSSAAPLALAMIGKHISGQFVFGKDSYHIEGII